VAGEKNSRQLCVAHIAYAPLIFELSVAHIAICATNRSNMCGAYSKCVIDKTRYFADDPSGGSHVNIGGAF
jgi:hypothetical protein